MSALPATSHAPHMPSTAGGRLVSSDGRSLPLVGAELSVDAAAGTARVVLRQTFSNPHAQPLRLSYQVPMPADAAVSGYAFCFAGRRVVGEVDRKAAARERFEEALLDGKTAALLEQERSSLFTQEVGNVPPGAEVVCELSLDQPLMWRSHGGGEWEWRFPTTVAPRYAGAAGRVEDAARVAVDVSLEPMRPRLKVGLSIRDAGIASEDLDSPSHALRARAHTNAAGLHVELRSPDDAPAGVHLDRDVVVRWRAAQAQVGVALDLASAPAGHARAGARFGQLVVTPPSAPQSSLARDLIVLLDTSGSMRGEPLAQAKAVTEALIESLQEGDMLELVEFSTQPRRWRSEAVAVNTQTRGEALAWLRGLRAGGGTQMRDGILAALAPLRAESQRQVLLVTDGLISFEREIIAAIQASLPGGCRVHTLGIGSAVNRSLTRPAAQAGKGIEVIAAPGESCKEAAAALLARMCAPLVVDLELSGTALVRVAGGPAPDLFAGSPARVPIALSPAGGYLLLRGRLPQGLWEQRVDVPAQTGEESSPAVVRSFAREQVEALELERALQTGDEAAAIDGKIERLGLDFQISTRLTSWIAVSQRANVDPSEPTRRETIPHELPQGMSVAGLGLRPAGGGSGGHVLRNAEGSIVGTRGRGGPKLLGFISLGERSDERSTGAATRGRASARKRRGEGGESRRTRALPGSRGIEKESTKQQTAKPRAPKPAPPAARAPAAPRARAITLRGRLVSSREGKHVVEIDVSTTLTWHRPKQLEVLLASGMRLRAKVDARTTTRSGVIAADGGTGVIRVVFDCGVDEIGSELRFRVDGQEWIIQL